MQLAKSAAQYALFNSDPAEVTDQAPTGGNDPVRMKLIRQHIDRAIARGPEIRQLGIRFLKTLLMDQQDLPFDLPKETDDGSPWELTDEQHVTMHERLLLYCLHLLNDSRTKAEKKIELLDWVAAPLLGAEELKNAAFSFQACCVCAGYNADSLRDHILYTIAPKLDYSH